MHHTMEAGYRCGDREGCLKGTRKDVLQEIEDWLMSEQDQRIFWLNGLAGTGKSTIAQTFAETSFADGRLGASFFCSRDFEARSNLKAIFPTLAFQLAYQYPPFRKQLLQVLRIYPDVGRESLCSQMEKLIIGPLRATSIQTLIIIDALDECKDEDPASAILSILSRYVDQIPSVKFFITGRPEPQIRSGFRLESLVPITEVLKLHEVEPRSVNSDIKLFFQTKLTNLAKNRSDCNLTRDWPSSSDIELLCKKAAGFFIYASTVVKFVASKTDLPTERLVLITSLPQSTANEGMSGVDQLYIKVLEQAFQDNCTDGSQRYSRFKTVVGAVLLVSNPLSAKALSDLLRVPGTSTTLRPLHSLFLVPDNTEDPIHIYHKSFPDFLTDPKRCKDQRFFVDPPLYHMEILLSCLNLMKKRLKKNICNLDDHAILNETKDLPARLKTYIGDALGYACQFWTRHLVEIPSGSYNVEEVYREIDEVFTAHLLDWIEVLSLMGNLSVGVYALSSVQQWCVLVSCVWGIHSGNLYSHSFRQEFPISGHMMANAFYWNSLTPSRTLLPRCTILSSHFALPHPGFTNPTLQSSQGGLKWLRGPQLDGEHVSAQFPSVVTHGPLHTRRILLRLVYPLVTLLPLMELQAARWLSFLGIVVWCDLLASHQMVHCLYLEVMTQLSNSGMSRLVGLSRPSMATLEGFFPFPSPPTVPPLLQDLWTTQFVYGTLGQGSVIIP
jgi:hypothetical protein